MPGQFIPLWSPWFAGLGAVLGSVIGSYLATVLWRLPRGGSANRGRSACDCCGVQLPWHALVPLAGLALQGGRCRECQAPVSLQHSAIELACALAGAVLFYAGLPVLAVLMWLLIVLAVFDYQYLWLPNGLVAATALAALAAPGPDASPVGERLAAGLVGYAAFLGVAWTHKRSTGKTGLGGGDIKLFAALGLWTGLRQLPLLLLIACGIGIAFFLVQRLRGKLTRNSPLPFGTFLCLAAGTLAASMLVQATAPVS